MVVVVGLREIEATKDIQLTAALRNTTRAVSSTLIQIWQLVPLFTVNVQPTHQLQCLVVRCVPANHVNIPVLCLVQAVKRCTSWSEIWQKSNSEVVERPFLYLAANLIRLLFVFAAADHDNSARNAFCVNGQVYTPTKEKSFLKSGTSGVVEMNGLPGNFPQTLSNSTDVQALMTEVLKFKLHQVPLKILVKCSRFLFPTFKRNKASFYYFF